MRRFAYHKPTTLAEALQLKRSVADARFVAGGTDLIVRMKDNVERPAALISLRSVPELTGIDTNGVARIGATTLLHDLCEHAYIREHYPVIVQAVRVMGSVQIRNAATLGGNLCNASPAADTAPPLLILDARVRLQSEAGAREVALADFFTGPGKTCMRTDEILTDVLIEPAAVNTRAVFMRKDRVHVDLSIVSVAVRLDMRADGRTCERARVAVGAAAPTPLRLPAVEALFEGHVLDHDRVARAQEVLRDGLQPIDDLRASADYRRHIAGVFLKRAVVQLLD